MHTNVTQDAYMYLHKNMYADMRSQKLACNHLSVLHPETTHASAQTNLLPTPRVIEYSDDIVFLFHPSHLSYHLHSPLPDNSIVIVIVVSVWTVLLM